MNAPTAMSAATCPVQFRFFARLLLTGFVFAIPTLAPADEDYVEVQFYAEIVPTIFLGPPTPSPEETFYTVSLAGKTLCTALAGYEWDSGGTVTSSVATARLKVGTIYTLQLDASPEFAAWVGGFWMGEPVNTFIRFDGVPDCCELRILNNWVPGQIYTNYAHSEDGHGAGNPEEWTVEVVRSSGTIQFTDLCDGRLPADGKAVTHAWVSNSTLIPPLAWSIEGPSLGCLIEYGFNESRFCAITAGTTNGTITVVATDANGCFTKQNLDIGWCEEEAGECCGGGCAGAGGQSAPLWGHGWARSDGFHLGLSLGRSAGGQCAGALEIHEPEAPTNLYSPEHLRFLWKRPDVDVVRDGSGGLRQVRGPQGLADVVKFEDEPKYQIRFYPNSGVGPRGVLGYATSGTPATVWTIQNPDATASNRVTITESPAGRSPVAYEYTWLTNGWQLVHSNSGRTEITTNLWTTNNAVSPPELFRTETTVIRQGSGDPVAVHSRKFQKNSSWTTLVEETSGTGTNAQSTTYSYFPGSRRLSQVTRPDGSWAIYEYDDWRRPLRIYSAFGNAAPTTNRLECRLTEHSYTLAGAGDDPNLSPASPRQTAESVLGQPVSLTYHIFAPGAVTNIQCLRTNAALTDADNLRTITTTYTNGLFAGRLRSVERPDGTMDIFKYLASEPPTDTSTNLVWNNTNLVLSGIPNANKDDITEGTQVMEVVGPLGEPIFRETLAITSGNPITMARSTFSNHDPFGRPQTETHLDGTVTSTAYCEECGCGPSSISQPDGTTTYYGYDSLHRTIWTASDGVTNHTLYDAAGNVLARVREGRNGTRTTTVTNTYDTAGRVLTSRDALGNETTYAETAPPVTRSTTLPNGGTRLESYARDGTLLSVSGTAAEHTRYTNGVASDGGADRFFTAEIKLDANGNAKEGVTNFVDLLGRSYKTLYADGAASYSYYNGMGQLTNQVDADGVSTLYLYNAKGEQEFTVVDVDRDGVVDWAGPDRITQVVRDVVASASFGAPARRVRTYAWATEANVSNLVSTVETSMEGRTNWTTRHGLTWKTETTLLGGGRTAVQTTAPDGTCTLATNLSGRLLATETRHPDLGALSFATFGYDPHNRQTTNTDARAGSTVFTYDDADRLTSITTPDPGTGSQVTSNTYNSMGWITSVRLPDGQVVTKEYYTNGLLKKTYGARTYPVEYTYDYAGRMTTLKTWQNYAGNSGTATTAWNYDDRRGFLVAKTYADASTVLYTNTPAGRLKSRTWARGITTTYAYDAAGQLAVTAYSDGTSAATNRYDRLGRLIETGTSGSLLRRAYDEMGNLLGESWAAGPLSGVTVTNIHDSIGRRITNGLVSGGTWLVLSTNGYDAASRLAVVSDGTNSAEYTYLTGSTLVSQITFRQSGTLRMRTSKHYDLLNRLTAITNSPAGGGEPAIRYAYQYNAANQRIRRTESDASYWVHTYDTLGQVISGRKFWPDGTPVLGQQFDYTFDDIGNRKTAVTGGDQWGANKRYQNYTANLLNQYTSRTVPGYVDIVGTATSNATVTVWSADSLSASTPTTRKGEYFRGEVAFANQTSPIWATITNLAVLQQGTNADIIATNTGYLLLAQTPEAFTYDADGNLTSDSLWTNTWNAENRRTGIESRSGVPAAARVRVQWTHLPDGRWIERIVSTNTGSGYVAVQTNRYVWNGNVLLAVLNHTNGLELSFLRGLDLSGTPQGAGGVGGLLFVGDFTSATGYHAAACDGNGNVAALVNAADGTESARYEYGPFGEPLRVTGPMGRVNPLRFSTQYADDWTGDLKYLHRDYRPDLGRWPNRDPLGELAFRQQALRPDILVAVSRSLTPPKNLESDGNLAFVFVGNAPISHIDYLGLQTGCWHCGRAIDHALQLTLADVVRRYSNLSLWGKIKACAPIWVPVPGFDMAWDMNKITWDWGADMHCGKEKTCKGTVTVAGGCYDAWDVNFMSYGWAARLCGMPFGDFLAHVAGWKLAKPIFADDGEGNDWERPGQWGGFAIAGYNFSFNPPAAPSTLSACRACDKRAPYPNHLDSEWP